MRDCLVRDQRDGKERERLLRGVYTYKHCAKKVGGVRGINEVEGGELVQSTLYTCMEFLQ
jgi:hypothetical protein